MHILYYHQHFSTRAGSAGTRSYELARRLVARGHQVTMVCGSYAQGDTDQRKALFAAAVNQHVPLVQHIRRVLDERASHEAPARRFRDELEDYMSEDYADETLRTVTLWGRYAEIFAYDEETDRFSLEDQH